MDPNNAYKKVHDADLRSKLADLRSKLFYLKIKEHHFNIGTESGCNMITSNHQDYKGTQNSSAKTGQTINNALLRQSHFSLGDKSQESKDHYNSTYTNDMQPKTSKYEKVENFNFMSNIAIKGKDNNVIQSEARSK